MAPLLSGKSDCCSSRACEKLIAAKKNGGADEFPLRSPQGGPRSTQNRGRSTLYGLCAEVVTFRAGTSLGVPGNSIGRKANLITGAMLLPACLASRPNRVMQCQPWPRTVSRTIIRGLLFGACQAAEYSFRKLPFNRQRPREPKPRIGRSG